jgi:hypothetical protein
MEVQRELLLIHDLGTRWGWVVSVTLWPRFSPSERIPGTHCSGGWVGSRAGLDTEATGKIISPLPGIEPRSPGRPACSQTHTDWANRLTKIRYTMSNTEQVKFHRDRYCYRLKYHSYIILYFVVRSRVEHKTTHILIKYSHLH